MHADSAARRAEFLRWASGERDRLEALISAIRQQLHAVRHMIEVYAANARKERPPAPTFDPDSSRTDFDASLDLWAMAAERSGPTRRWRRMGPREEASNIRNAAAKYLRKKANRAGLREMMDNLHCQGVQIGSANARATVATTLRRSPLFDHTAEGYGLAEWSVTSAPERNTPSEPLPISQTAVPDSERVQPSMHGHQHHTPGMSPRRRRSAAWQIEQAAIEILRKKGGAALGREVHDALAAMGIQVNGKRPFAVVSARLSDSKLFDHTPDGYVLTEWLNTNRGPDASTDGVPVPP